MENNTYSRFYFAADFVVCLDASGSMEPYLEQAKENMFNFCKYYLDEMELNGKEVKKIRIKIITFRDADVDRVPFEESRFYSFQEELPELREYLAQIKVSEKKTGHCNALEAIALALKSDWTQEYQKRRHTIVVYSCNEPHPLGREYKNTLNLGDMPKDLKELGEWWEGISCTLNSPFVPRFGRLIVFAPYCYPWVDIQTWNRYWPAFSNAGEGLDEILMQNTSDILVGGF